MQEVNVYGNEVGVHTPTLSKENKQKIEQATNLKFEDSSWHNDACDSISNDDLKLGVFLPNSDKDDPNECLWDKFSIFWLDGEETPDCFKTFTFDEVVTFINNLNLKQK